MAFTRAIEVAEGDALNSRHQRSVARAANDRLRFAQDMPYRLGWALYNGARLVRNPSGDGLNFPAEGEFWKVFAHLKSASGYDWPLTGPGEPEGANLGSVIPQLIYGNPDLTDEPERIGALFPLRISGESAVTPTQKWTLRKLQGGAISADGSAQYAPAFEAAQTLFRFAFHPSIFHGKSYGGWQPQAPQDETYPLCAPDGFPGDRTPNRHYGWTGFTADTPTAGLHGTVTTNGAGQPVVTYAGSCPCGTTNTASGHVLYIADLPFAWYVYVSDGTVDGAGVCGVNVDRLDKSLWAEGPYDGAPALQHSDYPAILRAGWHYLSEFRGAESQRTPDTFAIERIAFDAQKFYTRQYPLAPAYGEVTEAGIEPIYPWIQFFGDDLMQFATLPEMRAVTSSEWGGIADHQIVLLAGGAAVGDTGAGFFRRSSTSTAADDGEYVVQPSVVTGAGRFVRVVLDAKYFSGLISPVAATPTQSGSTPFGPSTSVSLSCATVGAAIHYTTDGTTPTSASATYSAPLSLSATTTVKAFAIAAGYTNSAVSSVAYTQVAYGTIYYGCAAASSLDAAGILALSSSRANQINPANSYAFSPGSALYFYFAWPDDLYRQPSSGTGFMLGGFAVDMAATAPYSTMQNGWYYATVALSGRTYRVYRTTYTQTSAATIAVATS